MTRSSQPRSSPSPKRRPLAWLARWGPARSPRARHAAPQSRTRSQRITRRLGYLFVALTVLAGLLVGGGLLYVHYRYGQIKKVHAEGLVAPVAGKPFTMLLIGSDSRTFVKTQTQRQQFGSTTTAGGHRSDVTIVARFVPATHEVLVMSIPRDLWVKIPSNPVGITSPNRINAAYNTGPSLLIKTIETDLHIPINHFMSVTFTGFASMVNALGGVTMQFPDKVTDSYTGLDVKITGCQLVTGSTALALVRSRHLSYDQTGVWRYDGLSDFSRIQRQDAFFRALLTKVNRVKLNVFTINKFLGAAVANLTIDDTFSSSDLVSLAQNFHSMSAGHLMTETLPTISFMTTGGASVLRMVEPQDSQMIAAFNAFGSAKQATSTSTTLSPSMVNVSVYNSIDFAQSYATDASNLLAKAGFKIAVVANATRSGLAVTTISYGPGQLAVAKQVAATIPGSSTLREVASLPQDSITVTLGDSYLTGSTSTKVASIVRHRHRSPMALGGAHPNWHSSSSTTTPTSSSTTTSTTQPATSSTTTSEPQGATTTTSTTLAPILGTRTATQSAAPATTVPLGTINSNTQYEPWNPTPCTR